MDREKVLVIKVGSRLIGDSSRQPIKRIANQINQLVGQGYKVVLISSGAVEMGRQLLAEQLNSARNYRQRYKAVLAAIGQEEVIARWRQELAYTIGQVLVDRFDFSERSQFLKTYELMRQMLAMGVIPIVNENDSLNYGERALGNNDLLAAHIASMLGASWLVLITDTPFLYADFPINRNPIYSCSANDTRLLKFCRNSYSGVGVGGMESKIDAAKIASRKGIHTLISGDSISVQDAIKSGATLGTQLIAEPIAAQHSFKAWLSDISQSEGTLFIDSGAVNAIVDGAASLLTPGLVSFEGVFEARDVVSICDRHSGECIAKGIVRLSSNQLKEKMILKKLNQHECNSQSIVVHRNELVVLKQRAFKGESSAVKSH